MFNKKKKEKKNDLFDVVDSMLITQGEIIELIKQQQEAINTLSKSVETLQKLAIKQEL